MADNKAKALEEKEKGNAAYKKKDFETAIKHYDAAFSTDPTNITFLTNKGAVYYEQGNLDECIKVCEKAVEVGRENRIDFKLIAKAFSRIGTAYAKKDDLDQALLFYNKSLSEHRAPDIVQKVTEMKKQIAEKERLKYINPELAVQEKEKGNAHFKQGKYPEAIAAYTEAIKRNPDDAKIFSNRSACYTKLMEYPLALKDAKECIRLDPQFIKGHLRLGNILLATKEPGKAIDAFNKACEIDPNCNEAIEGKRQAMMEEDEDPDAIKKKAMNNPEILEILADPSMQLILQQMSTDPHALKEHSKNPDVAAKIQKLMMAGIVQVR